MRSSILAAGALAIACAVLAEIRAADPQAEPPMLKLHLRSRAAPQKADTPVAGPGAAPGDKTPGKALDKAVQKTVEWDPHHTALIVCDMWDDHWCQGAARRVAELAGPMNRVVAAQRKLGVLIIHAPSTTVDFYAGTPQRKRAQAAPAATPPIELATSTRWGTCWCWPDAAREPDLPIDDSDMGCDCAEKCTIAGPWKRQIATIEIAEPDAILDNGQELYNLLRQNAIEHVMIMGVHLNMCVLGRPFGIRQLVHLGEDVVLVRDLTDTMYNSRMPPRVNHFAGTDLVVEHIEKHWCPTITSVDLVGGKPFRFGEDARGDESAAR